MKDLKNKILLSIKNHKYFLFMFIIFLAVYVYSLYNPKHDIVQSSETLSADTLIPKGYVLVPIELVNLQAISGLINTHGVVDIFSVNRANKTKKILEQVKILRAPLNPESYAVLLPEEISKQFMNYAGPFIAVVQNKSANNESFNLTTKPEHKKITIEYNKD
ncbi:MAG: hypothetical protein ACK41T_01170 [Pseudobdellovibrio sp.]